MLHLKTSRSSFATLIGFALLAAAPAVARDIGPGFDYWQTVGSGATHYSFEGDPLPADFFCPGSAPFSGDVAFEGAPLESVPAGALGTTDTIIERLDTVRFNSKGEGRTSIRVRALSLESRDTISTRCGEWQVSATLSGQQPVTEMTLQQSELCPDIGVFNADLELNVELAFTSTSTSKRLTVEREVALPIFSETAYASGQLANQCSASTLPAGQTVYVASASLNLTPNDAFATGCACNCAGTICLPLLPEHNAELDEDHFIVPPCVFFGNPCIDVDVRNALRGQLDVLDAAGVIDEPVATALDKIVN